MRIINPATEQIISEIPEDTPESVREKYNVLKGGQRRWASVPLKQRVEIINKFSAALLSNIENLAADLTAEVGKPLRQSRAEINGARSRIQWLAEHAETYLSEEFMTRGASMTEKIVYEPLGVVCNISAWNYPYLVGVNVFIPALLAGDAVMYKPSEFATLTGLSIERLLKESGVPNDVFQVATGDKRTGELLLDIPFDGYFFTGSYRTGQYIYERVAARMVPCHCELGGKDPLFVCDDVEDIARVAAATADGAFYNNGQSCCSVERIYVHENVYDEYVKAFVSEVKSWKIGDPTRDDVYLGPLTRKEQLDFLEKQLDDARFRGASILTGGKRVAGKGNYFEPTILVNVDHSMSVMRDESFGPVIGIMKVRDDDEAVHLMQDTEFGLTAAVYSGDQGRAERILKEINSGTGYWNCCDRVSAAVPWSGRQHSGIGVTLSHAGIRAFTKPKAYHLKQ